ncbi:MAG: hypothetical protein AB7E21_06530 [Pseudodonghicola sp.]
MRFSGWSWRRLDESGIQVTFRDGSVAEVIGGVLVNAREEGEVTQFAEAWRQKFGEVDIEIPGTSDDHSTEPM